MSRSFVKRLAWGGSIGVIVLTAVIAVVVSRATNDIGASVGLSLAGGALVLAAVAAWAATFAYADTLRAPRLTWELSGPLLDPQVQIPLTLQEPRRSISTGATPPEAILWFDGQGATQTTLQLQVTNDGDATARNILATMTFTGMRVDCQYGLGSVWTPLDRDGNYYASTFIWDGDITFAVHGAGRARNIPSASLNRCYLTSEALPTVQVDIVCDGFDSHERGNLELIGLHFPSATLVHPT